MFSKILVALDNSTIGQHVFEAALALAKQTGADLMLLHVLAPYNQEYPTPLVLQSDSIYPTFHTGAVNNYLGLWEELKQEGIEFLTLLSQQANASGVRTEFSQNFGDPGKTICDLAQNWKADLIIVGRRGRRGLSEFFLGSVSNYVLHHAHCSVLTIQGPIHPSTEPQPEAQTASV